MSDLKNASCEACNKLTPRLTTEQVADLLKQIKGWKVVDNNHIFKEWKFKDFSAALKFTNKVSEISEQEGHHPDIKLGWGYVEITIYTHAIHGLSKNDFILAAKIDALNPQ